jgi:SAM-dependent methyltransferase
MPPEPVTPRCRFCSATLRHSFVDLGMSPLCEAYVPETRLSAMEPFYPLHVKVCHECLLVQLEEFVSPEEIFGEYAYFSSYSDSWVRHAASYVDAAVRRFALDERSLVVELASNDGYLLQHVVARGVPALGIEPAANIAQVAIDKGIDTVVAFFGTDLAGRLADERGHADLVVANNVLAHVPDLNDFVAGVELLLADGGVATFEFPHLERLVEGNQFDTIYHEHFSYFSFLSARAVLEAHRLLVFDVEELPSHGGSLRVFARRAGSSGEPVTARVRALEERERALGYDTLEGHAGFAPRVHALKWDLLEFLIARRREGQRIAGYGAPGKGNTLLNFCGIREDLVAYTVDRNPYKQGQFLPGTHIPIEHPDVLRRDRPDCILILPWNLSAEISAQLDYTREWGAELVVPIPEVRAI